MKRSLLILAALGTLLAAPVVAGGYGQSRKDIVDTAISAGSFDTLVAAVKAAGLVETLRSEGPFTVFAPTDEAFARIPADKLQALLADKDALTRVLTYHVVPGRVLAADVVRLDSAKTAEGSTVRISTSDGAVRIDDANVIKADILASNGVIHVIDTVILPD
ncbi:MAG: fasciclin domain-containing protein [Acidobacteriota bacterium]